MVNENLVNLTNNKKPIELVQELKDYEVKKSSLSPTARSKIIKKYGSNYLSEDKEGYGPCSNNNTGSCGNFSLRIECHNWDGLGGIRTANSTSEALLYAYELEHNSWQDSYCISNEVTQQCAALVRETVEKHNLGKRINGYVKVKGNFWGGPSWSYSY